MTCSTSLSGKNRIFLIAGILMIATTLRVTFTGAAPLLDTIRSAYSLTTAQTGLLTTLPLLAFALISPLAAPVARRFGMERSLFAALLLICKGTGKQVSQFALSLRLTYYLAVQRSLAVGLH
ncbi:hypothetical protein EIMP300_48150 [Escherichia coli]|uniref:Major facilitator superfamily (MFS) profile domain-containing protein n=1 Tax=Escherichia coli TaxID=562 RepID=A0A8S0FT21_ECOLX|nr:hypothetical protein EIMP300_48150 [Escherichia coli]